MFCTQCGIALEDQDRFCRHCGRPGGATLPPHPASHRLTRDIRNKKIAAVCAGFAQYLEVDVVLVRVLWLAIALCTGVGFIAYLVAWIIMPKEPVAAIVSANQFVPHNP